MSDTPAIALICSENDRARVWGLAAWLMRQGGPVVVGWNAHTDPEPGWLVVCYSDATVEDIEVSRAVAAFLAIAPRERLLRVELRPEPDAGNGPPLPPVLACDRGPDGLLVSLPPPVLAGSLYPGHESVDIEAVGARLLKMAGTSKPQTRRSLFLRTSVIALTATIAISLALGGFSVQLGNELDRSRAAEAEAVRFADMQLIEIAGSLQASARQGVMIAAGEAILARGIPGAATDEDRARRIRLLTWLAEARDLSGDPSGAMHAYSTAMALGDEWDEGSPTIDGMLALAELTSSAGIAAYRAGDIERARSWLDASREYADALLALAPGDRDARQRMASAHLSSAAMAVEGGEPEEALESLQLAIAGFEALQREYGEYTGELANALGWAADAHRANGQLAQAADLRAREAQTFADQLRDDPGNHLTMFRLANANHAEAVLRVDAGEIASALRALDEASNSLERLAVLDPENARYLRLRLTVERDRAEVALFEGSLIRAQLLIDRARRLRVSRDPQGSNDGRVLENASFDILSGQVALAAGAYEDAAVSAADALAGLTREMEPGRANAHMLALKAHLLRYDALMALGRPEAPRVLRDALAQVDDTVSVRDLRTRDLVSRVYWLAGEGDQAIAIRTELEEAGYARPDFVSFWARPDTPETVSNLNRQGIENDG
ncbi:MAG: hypothetical protein ACQRW7_07695 [Caulobacterales bacterium]|uniref:hypothetical protein n=1 Tax=Glycocaulis sp. TaxID=1969725 RepID=UPI003F9F4267